MTNTKLCLDCYFINVKLVKLLKEGFKRPVFCNEYQAKVETRNLDNNNLTRFPPECSFQEVRRLFVFPLITLPLLLLIIQLTTLTIESYKTGTQNIFFQECI